MSAIWINGHSDEARRLGCGPAKSYAQAGVRQGPDGHHAVSSKRHTSRGAAGAEVIEVRPPKKAKKERRTRHAPVEPEFFPLVSAAHEFNTPLVAMLGYTDLLRNGHLGPVTEKQRQVL